MVFNLACLILATDLILLYHYCRFKALIAYVNANLRWLSVLGWVARPSSDFFRENHSIEEGLRLGFAG